MWTPQLIRERIAEAEAELGELNNSGRAYSDRASELRLYIRNLEAMRRMPR